MLIGTGNENNNNIKDKVDAIYQEYVAAFENKNKSLANNRPVRNIDTEINTMTGFEASTKFKNITYTQNRLYKIMQKYDLY